MTDMVFNTQGDIDVYNNSLADTTVHMIGNSTVIAQVIQLLAYIRHGIRNNMKADINVKLGCTVANVPFMFDVNGQEVPDMVLVDKTQIN